MILTASQLKNVYLKLLKVFCHERQTKDYRVRFFGRMRKRICDLRSLGSCRIKGTDESTLDKDSSVPLIRHDPNDLRSQIRFRILLEKRTHIIEVLLKA